MVTALITDPARRDQLVAAIREIVGALDAVTVTQIDELGDRAILRAYVADLVPDPEDVAGAAMAAAVAAFDARGGVALFGGGVTRIGWTVAHLAEGAPAEEACAMIDTALLRYLEPDWVGDYDLISGLVGFGVYALERGEAGQIIARRVLDHLERLARPRGAGLAWHTGPELLPAWQRTLAPDGYWNLGLAHGMPGVIGWLARCVAAGIDRGRARALLDAAVAHLLDAEPPAPTGRYPGWQPTTPDESRTRLAWCYGDLGVSIALLAAANACDDAGWRATALDLARTCAACPFERAAVFDTGICHGAAGVTHLFHRLYRATGDAMFGDAARTWLDRIFAIRRSEPIAGYPARFNGPEGTVRWNADASLLCGAPGVALVLHALATDSDPAWDRLLLADL